MLKVTPLYGSYGHNPSSQSMSLPPMSTLIEYGGKKVLIDVGWDESCHADALGVGLRVRHGTTTEHHVVPNDDDKNFPKTSNSVAPCTTGSRPCLPEVDAVLVCNSTLGSIGGLPLFYGDGRRSNNESRRSSSSIISSPPPPIYGTLPTCKMGQMNLYDAHAQVCSDGGDIGWDLDTVDTLFQDRFVTLRYSQPVVLKGRDREHERGDHHEPQRRGGNSASSKVAKDGLEIVAHRSGVVVGGSFWVLRRLIDSTVVVVAPSYHHASELHLDASTLHQHGASADVLVVRPGGPGGALSMLSPSSLRSSSGPSSFTKSVRGSAAALIEFVMVALRTRGANVLLPVDTCGRVLELLVLLDRHWQKHRLGSTYKLCWVGSMTWNTLEHARSQLEWMAAPLGSQFDTQRGHPLAFPSVTVCTSVAELEQLEEASGDRGSMPMVVLASGASLDRGPARDLFLKYAENPDNAVVLTDAQAGGTLRNFVSLSDENDDVRHRQHQATTFRRKESTASQLLARWCEARRTGTEMDDLHLEVEVPVPIRSVLAGEERRVFEAAEEESRRKKAAAREKAALLREVELARGRLRLGLGEAEVEADVDVDADVDAEGATDTGTESNNSGDAKTEGSKSALTTQLPPKKKSRFDQSLFLKYSKPCHMTFEVRENAVGIGQVDSVAKHGVQDSIGQSGDVLEDDYGIAVIPSKFNDIVTGVDPTKVVSSTTGRLGDVDHSSGGGGAAGGAGSKRSRPKHASGGADDGNDNDDYSLDDDEAYDEATLEAMDLSEGRGIIRGRKGREPVKVTVQPRTLEVLAEVAYIPLEGRVDSRAARQTVRSLQPRKVVVLGGGAVPVDRDRIRSRPVSDDDDDDHNNEDDNDDDRPGVGMRAGGEVGLLAKAVQESRVPVVVPSRDGRTITLDVGHAAYLASLVDTVRDRTTGASTSDSSVVLEPPHEARLGDCIVSLIDRVATGKKKTADGSVVLAPVGPDDSSSSSSQPRPHVMVSDGDVYLTDLRSDIVAQGLKAEYSAHVGHQRLVVNGKIVVRKDHLTGKIDIEGPLCEAFFAVRSLVCSQYVTL